MSIREIQREVTRLQNKLWEHMADDNTSNREWLLLQLDTLTYADKIITDRKYA